MPSDKKSKFSIEKIKSLWLNSVTVRFFVVLLGVLPAFIVAYTLLYRLPLISEVTEKINEVQPLAVELEKSRMAYSPTDGDAIKEGYAEAVGLIPANRYELKIFLDKFKKMALSKGFNVAYSFGTIQPVEGNLTGISSVPVKASFTLSDRSNPGLPHFLRFTRRLLQKFAGVGLNNITVNGNGVILSSIEADFVLWVAYSK